MSTESPSTLPTSTASAAEHVNAQTSPARSPLPIALLLSGVGFITLLTEVLPAGVLPALASDLGVSASVAGQSVAVFALGCIAAAIPLTRATARLDRRTLILVAIAVSALANLGTAFAPEIWSHLATRFVAGLVAGLVWAMLPGYTRGFTPAHRFGATLGIVLSGATFAFAVGVPLGTLLSEVIGWRAVFAVIAGCSVILWAVAAAIAPRVQRPQATSGSSIGAALRIPAVIVVLVAVAACIIAQNMAYTYLAPVLDDRGVTVPLSVVLAAFGLSSVVGTLGAGRLADRKLGTTVIVELCIGAAGLLVFFLTASVPVLLIAAAAWGLAFGGYSVLFQVAIGRVGGDAADAAQSALVTVWNISIALGGGVGGIVLAVWGPGALVPAAAVLTALAIPLGVSIAASARKV